MTAFSEADRKKILESLTSEELATFKEAFTVIVKKMQESDTENEVQEAYRVFDKDRAGYITASELRMIFRALPERLSEAEIDEMLRAADTDGSGQFEYDEFKMMLGASNRGPLF